MEEQKVQYAQPMENGGSSNGCPFESETLEFMMASERRRINDKWDRKRNRNRWGGALAFMFSAILAIVPPQICRRVYGGENPLSNAPKVVEYEETRTSLSNMVEERQRFSDLISKEYEKSSYKKILRESYEAANQKVKTLDRAITMAESDLGSMGGEITIQEYNSWNSERSRFDFISCLLGGLIGLSGVSLAYFLGDNNYFKRLKELKEAGLEEE